MYRAVVYAHINTVETIRVVYLVLFKLALTMRLNTK
jgi:hypothetical protein